MRRLLSKYDGIKYEQSTIKSKVFSKYVKNYSEMFMWRQIIMMNNNVYFILGVPCSGKSSIGAILKSKYNMFYFSGDAKRFDYFKLADATKHPFMTKNTSEFYGWTKEEMIDWERGVISEQTPFITSELNKLSSIHDLILFDGILDLGLISRMVNKNRVIYLTTNKAIIERDFFDRDDHKPLLNSILNTPNITDTEKQRRIQLRKEVARDSFCVDAAVYGIKQFERNSDTSIKELAERVEELIKNHGIIISLTSLRIVLEASLVGLPIRMNICMVPPLEA